MVKTQKLPGEHPANKMVRFHHLIQLGLVFGFDWILAGKGTCSGILKSNKQKRNDEVFESRLAYAYAWA